MPTTTIYTICTVIKLERVDGEVMGFTSLNHDLEINGVTYLANSAIEPTALEQKADLSTDNLEVKGFLDSSLVTGTDITNGVYDGSYVTVALIDFVTLPTTISEGVILLRGRVGDITTTDAYFNFDIRSLSEIISRPLQQKTSPACRYKEFGGDLCGLDLVVNGLQATNAGITEITDNQTIRINNPIINSNFVNGTVTFTSGDNINSIRNIVSVSGTDSVILDRPTAKDIVLGDLVTVKAHCNRTQSQCKAYNNFNEFGNVPSGGNFIPGLDRILVV